MLPTEKATGLFSQTMNIWGNNIWEKKLEFTTNETLIRNNHLISNRKAATNAMDKYEFYYLYLVSDEKIKEGDWCLNNTNEVVFMKDKIDAITFNGHKCKKIVATTDIYLLIEYSNNFKTPYSTGFHKIHQNDIEDYVKSYNEGNPIKEIQIEVEPVLGDIINVVTHDVIKTNPDNTVIINKPLELKYNRQDVMDAAFDYFDKFKDFYKTHGLLDPVKSVEWFDEKYPK